MVDVAAPAEAAVVVVVVSVVVVEHFNYMGVF